MTADRFKPATITAVILAGGEARRMAGRDKGLIELGGKPMIEYVITRLRPQVSGIIINANRNHERYLEFGYPVIADYQEGFNGPLAGIASSMQHIGTELLVTAPCDSPFLPDDLVERLWRRLQLDDAEISVAHDGNRIQPVFSLMQRALHSSLVNYLEQGERKIDRWFARHRTVMVDFSDKPDTFSNINTPEDIERLEAVLAHA